MKEKLLSVIVPVYNEEENIPTLIERLHSILSKYNYELLFINDGSRDKTLDQIKEESKKNPRIKAVSFIRNFGHQMALSAGYDYAKGDAVVTIDADLQDPPELIDKMMEHWRDGYEVVLAKRVERDDTFFKKLTAFSFYRLLNSLSDISIPQDVGDYRLIDRKVVTFLNELPEKNRFWRGLVAWGGFKTIEVPFSRQKRLKGETHYPLSKMISLALEGITSFSTKPLRMSMYLGFLTSIFSIVVILIKLVQHLIFPNTYWAPGWPSLFFAIVFLGGVQLITLGIIGEYIAKIFKEIQSRPRYLIRETVNV